METEQVIRASKKSIGFLKGLHRKLDIKYNELWESASQEDVSNEIEKLQKELPKSFKLIEKDILNKPVDRNVGVRVGSAMKEVHAEYVANRDDWRTPRFEDDVVNYCDIAKRVEERVA